MPHLAAELFRKSTFGVNTVRRRLSGTRQLVAVGFSNLVSNVVILMTNNNNDDYM